MANEGDDEPSFFEGSLPPEFSEIHDGTSDFEKMENAVFSSPEMHRRTNFTAGINDRAHVEPGHFDTEKQQLLHDLHLCKMEISKKVLQMDNMKADQMALVDEMEERLQEAEHQRKLLQTKLDSQQNVHSSAQEEMKKRHEVMRSDLEKILKRQRDLELINEKLQNQAGDVRRVLGFSTMPHQLSQEKLYKLKTVPEESLSLRDFTLLKLQGLVEKFKEDSDSLRQTLKEATDEGYNLKNQYEKIVDKLTAEHKQHAELIVRFQKLSIELKDTQKQIKDGDHRINFYDQVKSERDSLAKELEAQQTEFKGLQQSFITVQRERDELSSDLTAAKQSINLLQRDKEFLGIQNVELNEKLAATIEKLKTAQSHAEDMQKAREETYEKYVASRQEDRFSFDDRLKQELSEIKARHEHDLEHVKNSLNELHERERKALKENNEILQMEKNRAMAAEQEVKEKNENLWQDLQRVKAETESRITKIEGDAKVKLFEADRTVLSLEESLKNSRNLQLENDKLSKKLKLVTAEYEQLQSQCQQEILNLKHQIKLKETGIESVPHKKESEKQDRNSVSESELIMQKLASRFDISKLSDDYTSYHKIASLEHANSQLQHENRELRGELESKTSELEAAQSVLDGNANQPFQLLMSKIKLKDAQCNKKDRTIANLEHENSNLNGKITQLQFDVEKLLNNRKEILMIKNSLRRMVSEREIVETDATKDVSSGDSESQLVILPNMEKRGSNWENRLRNKTHGTE
ncbi:progesterone-induced-blocking factor 1-like [Convolutriloba macropyga]|uniref:progesterone-induced-blocking factor 1-like n=1 Tax=Convolutriloba macropyga TaxID=536237 RepID=UPI003F521BA2